ncbi:VOC family protein [Kitasatospora paracochleata]|uniref:Catechol 2,3-dioxygenase-like lactoylglutathione lyase family enzyme n=1 Tax=Kitasatospora paracochleata TaxID=58354 RepID=A0ABT1ITC3_9ACTN|nr:VOC family protein [Kitasatospora paracochleata]MCP2308385.1 catechol 2,3-dioxygenase-like lactoylglutathione lyase family enzyme [Kitasatospora paracochleata]
MTGIPGALAVHHVAYTVPDLDQAVAFFTDVLDAQLLYRIGPVEDKEGDWMTRQLGVHRDARAHIAMLRIGPVTNLELFEYTAPDQRREQPRNSDIGGHHLAIAVADVDAAAAYLRQQPGVEVLGEPQTVTDGGPIHGDRWVYFRTPWGLQLEVLNMPIGMPYERHTKARLYSPLTAWS